MTWKLAFSTFLTRFLPAGINNQDESSTLPKWPWFIYNNNEKKMRMAIVLHTQQKGKMCDWSYFLKAGGREGCFPSSLQSRLVPLTASIVVHFVWHMLWSVSEERCHGSGTALCPRRIRQIFCSLSFWYDCSRHTRIVSTETYVKRF